METITPMPKEILIQQTGKFKIYQLTPYCFIVRGGPTEHNFSTLEFAQTFISEHNK